MSTGKHAATEGKFQTWGDGNAHAEQPVQYPEHTNTKDQDHSGLAIGAFVSSLILPLVGLVLGIVAFRQDRKVPGRPTGFAKAAIWVGSIFTALGVVLMVVMVSALASTPGVTY